MNSELNFLFENACSSIKLRLKKELLLQVDKVEEQELVKDILQDSLVKKTLKLQQADGWINEDFHSEKGVETAIRIFYEKGMPKEFPAFNNMLEQLELRKETFDNGSLQRVGKILDDLGLGGSKLIRATMFAYVGMENMLFVQEQIKRTLEVMEEVSTVSSVRNITYEYKKYRIFNLGIQWPSIYHLRLLAYTKSWRTTKNLSIVASAVEHLFELSPIPPIHGYYKSQIVAPASFAMHDFRGEFDRFKSKDWMMWLHRMELLARMDMINRIPKINQQVILLEKMLFNKEGIFSKRYSHHYFKKWNVYTGLALEEDWRVEKRYLCDIIFRTLLIIHYSKTLSI